MAYAEKLKKAVTSARSTLCVGLDPNLHLLPRSIKQAFATPEEQVLEFCKKVIDLTHPYCAAYKPNLAFFEALGDQAYGILRQVINYIPDTHIVIADAKRGDISSTAEHYRITFFDKLKVDALTVNPLMGFESLDAYIDDPEKALYVLTLTSNPGASDFFQKPFDGYSAMAESIASSLCARMESDSTHLGMVIGATQTDKMVSVLEHHSSACLLIPGIGAQGGNIESLTLALKNHHGTPLINSSRGIIYAGGEDENWEEKVRSSAERTRQSLAVITEIYAR